MSNLSDRACATILLFVAVAAVAPASSHAQAIDPAARAAIRRTLPRGLRSSLRDSALRLLVEPEPAKRALQLPRFASDSQAARFVLTVGERDPSPAVRARVVRLLRSSRAYPAMARHPQALPLLEQVARAEPDHVVALDAIEAMRGIRMGELTGYVSQRLAAAQGRLAPARPHDVGAAARAGLPASDSVIRVLLEEQERWISLRSGTMLPSFLRRVPPRFSAKGDGPVRVLAFGDFGTGQESQLAAAAAMRVYYRGRPFDFAITLGDNFYNVGMLSTDDPRWTSWYEDLYTPLGIPFYATMGNHDWGHVDSPAAEIVYSNRSPSWRMPSPYYTFTAGDAQFFAIDTQEMSEKQLRWLDSAITASTAKWKIVYGHFQAYSATRKDNPVLIARLVPLMNDRVDIYLCGHDHNLQALRPERGVHYFVAGAGGAGTYETDSTYDRSIARFETYGFSVLDIARDSVVVRLVDKDQKELHATVIRK